ncbi:unnamed protein product [Orchesella dallaii]|uniref:Neutral ceramidase n=1 Tax=Orchesella dallaii TaxID=48710 RepID=A0ABP1QEL5_9HEXA
MNLLLWKSSISFLITVTVIWANLAHVSAQDDEGVYRIGTGISDITGPPTGVLSGYLKRFLQATGIHTRLYARSFLVESKTTSDAVVYVTCDLAMFDHGLKLEIVKKLRAKYGDKFTEKNILISATHTHSGPSGYMQYQSYIKLESYGFKPANFWAIVDGVVESIEMAESSAVDGRILVHKGDLPENANRRTEAYDLNPEADPNTPNTDQEMILLKFESTEGNPLGAFNWWPVLPISFNIGFNPYISSDTRGYAAQVLDTEVKKQGETASKFVSGFGSSNQGDVIPLYHSGSGGLETRLAEVQEKAMKQFQKAKELFDAATVTVTGPIKYVHQYVNATNAYGTVNGVDVYLCKAALGFPFVGLNPGFESLIGLLLPKPSDELKACQYPKEVAIATGEMTQPWDWAPSIFSTQILQIGNIDIVALPGDFTTMAGRRVRNAVKQALEAQSITNHEVILAGLANNYISYVVTPEEYEARTYEGGATIYGPNTVPVFERLYGELTTALLMNTELQAGPTPPNFIDRVPNLPEKPDNNLYARPFGAPLEQPARWLTYGREMKAVFVGGKPRNNSLRGGSFFIIEKQQDDGNWQTVRTDADLDTRFNWNPIRRQSEVYWKIPTEQSDALLGTYRVRIFGHSEVGSAVLGSKLRPYTGVSDTFEIIKPVP